MCICKIITKILIIGILFKIFIINNLQKYNIRLIGYQERKKFISKAIYIKDFDGEYIEDEDS